jgi:predicted neuraminidase
MKLLCLLASALAMPVLGQIRVEEFIAENPPTPTSHASTICDSKAGLLAAWFGGTKERARDCVIWLSRHDGRQWSTPVEVARGDEDGDDQWPCWNPVLFQRKSGGALWLFYKVGPSPAEWWGRFKTSRDGGLSWSRSTRLPNYTIGPVRNKPVELADGTILCGASTENQGWRVHMEWFRDPHTRWQTTPPLNSAMDWGAIQPTILLWPGKRIQILCRSKQRSVVEAWSEGNVREWSRMRRTQLPNPNSAIDAVMLQSGQALLVYNPSTENRSQLVVGRSPDGSNWNPVLTLEDGNGEFSYPAIIQDRGGMVHVTYTWKREKIKHVMFDPADLK